MTLKMSFTNFVPALCWNDPTFHRIHRISNMDRTLMRVYLHEVLLTRREPSWRHECPGKAETSIFDGVLRLLHGHHHTDAKHWHDVFGSNGEYRCTLWYQSWNSGCSLSLYQTIGRITLMRRPLQLRWRPGTKAPFNIKNVSQAIGTSRLREYLICIMGVPILFMLMLKWLHASSPMNEMMTSSSGNIFRAGDPLWREFTGQRWIPLTNGQWRGPLIFFYVSVGKLLDKQSCGW